MCGLSVNCLYLSGGEGFYFSSLKIISSACGEEIPVNGSTPVDFSLENIYSFLISQLFCRSYASCSHLEPHSRVGLSQILFPAVGRSIGAYRLEPLAQNRQFLRWLLAKNCLPRWRLQPIVSPCQLGTSLLPWEARQMF